VIGLRLRIRSILDAFGALGAVLRDPMGELGYRVKPAHSSTAQDVLTEYLNG
jgi:hypothetical protein